MKSQYEKEFYKALDVGKKHGFSSERYSLIEGNLLSSDIINIIEIAVNDKWGGGIDSMAGKCVKVHSEMKPIIESILGVKAYLTFGYIKLQGKYVYKRDINELLENFEKAPVTEQEVSLHAWITLPSMEIIDLTTMVSWAIAKKITIKKIDIVWGKVGQLGMEFFPQLAGNE